MAPVNRLIEFRTVLHSAQTAETSKYPPSSRPVSPSVESSGLLSRARRRRKRLSEEEVKEQKEEREFLAEGYQIHKHLTALSNHIKLIRRAYLSTQAPPISSRSQTPNPQSRARGTGAEAEDDPEQRRLRALERAKVLTDREREEVDLRCRVVLQGCRERVGVLEVREKIRQNRSKPSTTSSLLTTFLPSLATDASSTGITPQQRSTILTAHHASILWSLNNSLLTLSDVVREMQEERGKIREERGKSLGGMVDKEFVGGGLGNVLTRRRVGGDGKPIQLTIPTASFAKATPSKTSAVDLDPSGSSSSNGDDNAITLSDQQIQQFSSENDTLLESMNTTLNTVLRAEKSLLEISQLQSTLIAHLATQTEAIELLYDEAIETVADLDRANTQLKKAKERGKEGRLYLVVFLIMASLTLLFLDWYS